MSLTKLYQLEVWKGGWNLPSIDPECLRAIAFVSLSEAPVGILLNNAPWSNRSRDYPVLTGLDGGIRASGAENIILFLKNEGFHCAHDSTQMTPYEEADAYALEGYARSSLSPLLDYLWWADEDFFRRVSQPWYAKDMSLYGKFIWVHWQRRRIISRLFATPHAQISDDKIDLVRKKIVQRAKRCLDDLSVKIGQDKTFVFGLQPSALDTTIFAYLAPLFYIPWKNKDVRQELFMDNADKFKNLKSYVDRFRKRYLHGSALAARTVHRPIRWYDTILDRVQKHRDTLVFLTFAVAVNVYLLRRTIGRLRFSWPAFDDHSRQRSQEYLEMAKNLGLNADMPLPPS